MRFGPDLHTPVGLGVVKGTRLDGGLHEDSEKPLLGSGCRFSARDPRCGAGEGAPIVVPVSSAARTVLSRFRTRTRRVTRIGPKTAGATASMKAGRKRASTKPKFTAKNVLL